MSFNRITPALAILVAIVSAFVPLEWWPLILLLIGLVFGFVAQEKDPVTSVFLADYYQRNITFKTQDRTPGRCPILF